MQEGRDCVVTQPEVDKKLPEVEKPGGNTVSKVTMGKVVRIQQGRDCVTMTLPAEIAKELGVVKGDYVIVEWDAKHGVATIRKMTKS